MKITTLFLKSIFIACILYPIVDGKNNPGTYMIVGILCGATMGIYEGMKKAKEDEAEKDNEIK